MTLEKLIELAGGKGVEEIESLTDDQLEEYFRPMFNVTRPVPKNKDVSAMVNGIVKPSGSRQPKSKTPMLKGKALTPEQAARLKELETKMGEKLL